MYPLPEIKLTAWVIAAAMDMSLYKKSGGGLSPQSWSDVQAFMSMALPNAEGWTAKALFDMSNEYVSEFVSGGDPLRSPPIERDNDG